jgi:hypothetical protein
MNSYLLSFKSASYASFLNVLPLFSSVTVLDCSNPSLFTDSELFVFETLLDSLDSASVNLIRWSSWSTFLILFWWWFCGFWFGGDRCMLFVNSWRILLRICIVFGGFVTVAVVCVVLLWWFCAVTDSVMVFGVVRVQKGDECSWAFISVSGIFVEFDLKSWREKKWNLFLLIVQKMIGESDLWPLSQLL